VIEHEQGLVLFDTGQDRRSVTDADYFPSGLTGVLYSRLARFAIEPSDTLTAQLNALGYDVSGVRTAILSHLHQDHIGGIAELSDAEIVVSKAEWDELAKPFAEVNGLLRAHIDLPGLHWNFVTPRRTDDLSLAPFAESHDLFGDGSLVLVPTPGHTPGSMSLLLRQEGMAPMLFVGDLTYDADLLAQEKVPGVGSRRGLLRSTRAVLKLKERYPDLVILAAHDPAAAALLERALRPGTTT
jgi:glyoxylase-like metal-dependent hydrolase (beta-lactamase superfamily II)